MISTLLLSQLYGLFMNSKALTLLHSEQPKLHRVLAVLSAIGLKKGKKRHCSVCTTMQTDMNIHDMHVWLKVNTCTFRGRSKFSVLLLTGNGVNSNRKQFAPR